jgi:hypothetical protein
MIIYRTWTATDDCGQVTSAVQLISMVMGESSYNLNMPKDVTVPCGGDTTPTATGSATVYGTCGDMSVSYSDQQGCPQGGKIMRVWTVLRNGIPVTNKTQYINVQDCPTRGYGIVNLPTGPMKLTECTISPHVLVTDLDLPCELLTVVWTWGDGTQDTFKCNPAVPDSTHCKFDGDNLDTFANHTYSQAGVWKINVLIYGNRASFIPNATGSYEEGDSYVRFPSQCTAVDQYAGSVAGVVTLHAQTDEEDTTNSTSCKQPWIRRGLIYSAQDTAQDVDCSGYATFNLAAKFKKSGNNFTTMTVAADGSTIVSWATCAGGLEFKSTNLTHLTLFADGRSALWTGYGQYSLAPHLGDLPFTLYAVDGGTNSNLGDAIHFRLSDNSGNVLFDTNPCAAPITDIKVQPAKPACSITSDSAGLSVSNPAQQLVSALGTDSGVSSIPVGLVVGIVIGMMVFIVIVAAIVYLLLVRRQNASAATQSDKFVAM